LQGDMCPQKYYSITKSKNRSFMLRNAENDAHLIRHCSQFDK
jgi:hypothetical protein